MKKLPGKLSRTHDVGGAGSENPSKLVHLSPLSHMTFRQTEKTQRQSRNFGYLNSELNTNKLLSSPFKVFFTKSQVTLGRES